MTSGVLRIALLAVLLSSCSLPLLPGDAAPIVKIGLIAPFEGLGRPLGYSVLPAVKIAIAEANASGELGRYRAALVALNDDGYPPSAVEQVKALAQDPDVMVALGPWGSDTAEAAATAFEQARLPGLVAAPIAGRAAGVASLCPSPQALAQALVTEAARLGGQGAAVAGPDNALARAIAAAGNVSATPPASRAAGVRLYTGDAAAAANDWLRWRAEGWTGLLLGGPDLARPWFPELIGRGGPGSGYASPSPMPAPAPETVQAEAATCTMPDDLADDFTATYQAQTGQAPDHEARLAYAGARLLIDALASSIRDHRTPTRNGAAAALAREKAQPAFGWVQLAGDRWEPRP